MPRGGVKKQKNKKEIGRGPIEQCVGDFCSVPRGGVKKRKKTKRKNRSRTDRAVRREISPCATRWPERKKKIRLGTVCATSLGFFFFVALSNEVV